MNTAPYLEGLNERQKEAVLTIDGPLMVLAGAGSGKTRVIAHRIVHLIHQGVPPHHILAVTFTNKAAKEMRDRVHNLMRQFPTSRQSGLDSSPTVTTFHSLGVRLLREHHETLDLRKHFSIYDRSDSVKALKEALTIAGYSPKQFEPRRILSVISKAKGDAIRKSEFVESASSYIERVVGEVWGHYEQILKKDGALDFDDLLLSTLGLLESYPVVREVLQDRYQYIHVDEYQDTNKVQYEIARLLAGARQNICVVGDIDQNIYSWRGADIKNILQFERHFQGAKTVLLEENYRSTKTIIAASNSVIKQNRNRVDKTVFTNNHDGEKLTIFSALTGADEAEYAALSSKRLIENGAAPSDIAVLFRTNFQSRALEEAFLNYDVPYQVLGVKFFERKEIKDMLSYLRLALNPGSTSDLARVANTPPRGLGKVTVLKMIEGRGAEVTGVAKDKVAKFNELMIDIAKEARTKKISETLKFILKQSGLDAHFKDNGTEEDLARLENLRELVTLAIRYDELSPEEGALALLEDAALQSDQDELKAKEEKDAVRLMTVHAAKGLEFPYVFVTGLEEGLFPHERLDDGAVDHEEERRLFYVALTRAGKKVWLTHASTRNIFGSQRVNIPSSFLSDIDEEHLEREGIGRGGFASGFERTIEID